MNIGTPFFAAKSYEQAAQMTQQLKDLPTAAKYFDRAGQLYAEGGIYIYILFLSCFEKRFSFLGYRDSGAILYERCAPQFQQLDRAISIDFYLKAARLAEQEEKAFQAADLYEKAAMQAIRMGNFQQTTELLETVTKILTTMERYDRINRVILYRILLKLFNEDSVAGRNIFDQACQTYPTFDQWEDRDHIDLLLEAFDQDDKDLISERCQVSRQFF
jgi:tetratricopeptide (TPR) repeat protein